MHQVCLMIAGLSSSSVGACSTWNFLLQLHCWLSPDLHVCMNEKELRWCNLQFVIYQLIMYGLIKHVTKIIYTYISMTHYKSLISILLTCKYVTSSHDMSSFSIKNISKNSRSMPCQLSQLKNNSKNSRK
jgi:hypothetical protein